ncbi:hypothetical protein BDZ89DRAFT_1041093 [Hymenopellis radicata]|nr:hypothetical protein BDZ89DRAFT_1041093 [Hymenopellis radicata]
MATRGPPSRGFCERPLSHMAGERKIVNAVLDKGDTYPENADADGNLSATDDQQEWKEKARLRQRVSLPLKGLESEPRCGDCSIRVDSQDILIKSREDGGLDIGQFSWLRLEGLLVNEVGDSKPYGIDN